MMWGGRGGDKDPTIQHSCLHLLYLCEEKTLTEGRLAEMEQKFCHYQSTLTVQLGKKRVISDFGYLCSERIKRSLMRVLFNQKTISSHLNSAAEKGQRDTHWSERRKKPKFMPLRVVTGMAFFQCIYYKCLQQNRAGSQKPAGFCCQRNSWSCKVNRCSSAPLRATLLFTVSSRNNRKQCGDGGAGPEPSFLKQCT